MTRTSTTLAVLGALALNVGAPGASLAQTNPQRADLAAAGTSEAYRADFAQTTVLTMAPNGSWGAATADTIGVAIATAIARCKARHQNEIGCGAASTAIRSGWSLGIRCGSTNILAAEETLVEAEQAAINREVELRRLYEPDMPPCIRIVSVDPSGAIIAPYAADLARVVMQRRDGSLR